MSADCAAKELPEAEAVDMVARTKALTETIKIEIKGFLQGMAVSPEYLMKFYVTIHWKT
ncbi:MAG: hypothetical protein KAH64_06625 [Nitrosomonadaceae bacterium]|nr:hypothetical protein [Nitrosomonadaceae bacterium]